MTKEEFQRYVLSPDLLNDETVSGLKEIITDFPFFPLARMLYLRNLLNINSYKFESELTKHAIFIHDRKVLYSLLNEKYEKVKEFELLPMDKEAFKSFFNKDEEPEQPAFDYRQNIPFELNYEPGDRKVSEENEPIDLIDRFIIENPTIKPGKSTSNSEKELSVESSDLVDDGLITSTLAEVYVRQGLYKEALESYRKLCLKFPEKNSYFASQIEKIEKLISKE